MLAVFVDGIVIHVHFPVNTVFGKVSKVGEGILSFAFKHSENVGMCDAGLCAAAFCEGNDIAAHAAFGHIDMFNETVIRPSDILIRQKTFVVYCGYLNAAQDMYPVRIFVSQFGHFGKVLRLSVSDSVIVVAYAQLLYAAFYCRIYNVVRVVSAAVGLVCMRMKVLYEHFYTSRYI